MWVLLLEYSFSSFFMYIFGNQLDRKSKAQQRTYLWFQEIIPKTASTIERKQWLVTQKRKKKEKTKIYTNVWPKKKSDEFIFIVE